ncbi:hypothetical protein JJD41_24230 [Oxynema sp. CENA135]|uniref:hypothetical protein n=1 Tax=Oxynema sp. CENA135 TaxID=984206 RepID=UPI00190A20E3|nr:hypothetical protein [Oxynema sp. CENA135]MBK4732949.1 hypothetical protein [Oxynema sp. CENA135]
MNQFPKEPFGDRNSHQPTSELPDRTQLPEDDRISEVSEEDERRYQAAKKQFGQLYVILLVIGLAIGGVVAIGVVNLLDRWGLTEVPTPIEEGDR